MSLLRTALFLIGILLAIPILLLILLACFLPVSTSGMLYLAASALTVAGLLSAPWLTKQFPYLTLAGILGLLLIASLRLISASQNAAPQIVMLRLPQARETGWLSTLIDEQDSVIFGEALFHLIGGVHPLEHENISRSLQSAYAEMRSAQGVYPSLQG